MKTYHINSSVADFSIEVDESHFFEFVRFVACSRFHINIRSSYYIENDEKVNLTLFDCIDSYDENLGTFGVIREVSNEA